MRYLLTPITMFIWYLLTYLGLYYGMVLMLWMFSLSWIWLIVGYTFLIGIITFLVSSLPAIINLLILKFYRLNWVSVITHSIAGFFGIVYFYYLIFQNPPRMYSGLESTSILQALWNQSWLKTILLMFPFVGLQLGIIYQGIFGPIGMKLKESEAEY
ncbi:hypothetical protein NQT66_13200 [Cellulophaga baltica]|uniref:hypothetical protein n=1 Tax=Cellulophaga baltica TaxID=76594 RepID=UPI0021495B13|nr:hypothetical protein [Cellulophaga baltica]MCR1025773.1 hypothetical protein [Cellulophaga baltica]